ncbi:unnamed protein product [Staurois parvus]|uniref:Uncharacterized protein n=1 Tax=Staurois parvus TaxID=386267 RepID=A0ABN9DE27_9NEOB|nr:unnamed protein product [Staurois parvus]
MVFAEGSRGEEPDMRRSEDPTGRDGRMAKQVRGQTSRVGNREDGMVQGSGHRIVGSQARSATAAGQIQ